MHWYVRLPLAKIGEKRKRLIIIGIKWGMGVRDLDDYHADWFEYLFRVSEITATANAKHEQNRGAIGSRFQARTPTEADILSLNPTRTRCSNVSLI